MKKHPWTIAFTSCLLAFTVFMGMDTFVLSSAYQTDATGMNTEMFSQAEVSVNKAEEDETDQKDEEDQDNQKAEESQENEKAAEDRKNQKSADGETDEDSVSGASPQREKPGASSSGGSDGSSSDEQRSSGNKKQSSDDTSSVIEESGESGESDGASGSSSGTGSGSSRKRKPGSPSKHGSDGSSKQGSGSSSKSGNSFDEEEAAAEAALVTTDNAGNSETYEDDNVKITYTQYTTNGTTIHVADVQLSSAEYLKTAFAEDTYGKNVTEATSAIAEAHDAILAINGDYYGVQEKGYVIRNGIVYRDQAGESEVLCIYADGSMKIVDPSTVTAQELVDQGVWQAFSFGPGLVENGEISVSLDSEVGRAKASNPRTAIGIIDDLHYVFVVSDGRTDDSEGLSLYELASFMDQLGVQTAYNLDGGGSSTMVFQNQIINNPTGGFGDREREVSDIVYIG